VSRGSCGATFSASSLVLRFPDRLCWPSPYRDRVGRVTQAYPFDCLLTVSGIPFNLSRRTTSRPGQSFALLVSASPAHEGARHKAPAPSSPGTRAYTAANAWSNAHLPSRSVPVRGDPSEAPGRQSARSSASRAQHRASSARQPHSDHNPASAATATKSGSACPGIALTPVAHASFTAVVPHLQHSCRGVPPARGNVWRTTNRGITTCFYRETAIAATARTLVGPFRALVRVRRWRDGKVHSADRAGGRTKEGLQPSSVDS
jgi:hypothetical protein